MCRNAFEAKGQSGIYKIENRYNHKVYIGQAKDIAARMEQHVKNVRAKEDKYAGSIDAAIQSEGKDAFTYEVLILCEDDKATLDYNEARQIYAYDSKDTGYNKTVGNHIEKLYEHFEAESHVVFAGLFKRLMSTFPYISNKGQKFLLVGNYDKKIVDYLEMNECEYYIVNDNYVEAIMNIENKDFDIVISNPPYGKTGVEVTKTIIDNINYKKFINLLPANDYHRGKDNDLYKYVNVGSMKPINNGFKDAAVTTHVAEINKKPNYFISADEFEIENYIDDSLKKYFYENKNRVHYALDAARRPQFSSITIENTNNTVIIGIRDINHKHLAYAYDCDTYKWNVDKSIDINTLKGNIGKTGSPNAQASHYFILFNSNIEKDNFVKFMYSKDGFRFLSKVFTATNVDSMIALSKVMPKVDWTREWTVEEILKEYEYTEAEIKEVMNDLDNFKYMED